ncbi:MAG TPA: glycine betaine ABC transporter substrate-binding protein [Gemmataceae bacterium]
MRRLAALLLCAALPGLTYCQESQRKIIIGSKAFPESVVLGELAAQSAQQTHTRTIEHQQELGGSTFLWEALKLGGERRGVDLYPEYTGTLKHDLLKEKQIRTDEDLRDELAKIGILMSRPLGFNNTYALGMKEQLAARLNIRKISDLKDHPDLKFGFSNEFLERGDGWPSLRARYGLPQQEPRGLEHALAYAGLESGAIDLTELYSTDAEIRYYGLRVLQDDLHHFPNYYAVYLYRKQLADEAPEVVAAILQLEGRIPRSAILEMNSRVHPLKTEQAVPASQVASDYLAENPFLHGSTEEEEAVARPEKESLLALELRLTGQHLFLVAISLALAIVIAVPLGVLAARYPSVGQTILAATGVIQTIPSLALLVLLIPLPFMGIGVRPAIAALFLYSLLPIIRNTYTGLTDVPLPIRESAAALGLSAFARLRLIELPMAMRSILAGIKTSAVINVGTATLGGVIGAGGYGQRIMTGIYLSDNRIIAEGAVPAAILALLVQGLFELIERAVVPQGLRLKAAE